ncbi:hypothetical protein CYMTET_16568 [Cymbomonas tetramitiformis]|uniref:non-specific serine/threonine protein kinase n=1 Tax=Cymbomonas tetramitiformis TaxID=36881 RepID=A0AAE0GBY5_9CHLO|nr:hypothetical protein CYMTET_16568 [Cymbomonas tetramitiformis]
MEDLWEKYKRLQVIGAGSFGKVYKIQHKDSKEIYVMKRISLVGQPEEAQKEAFQEVAILKKLQHPHVVNIIEFSWDEVEQDLLIVMDFCDAGDLFDFVQIHNKDRTFVPEETIWFFMVQLLSALAYVHTEKRIMHRDFKSQNVFLAKKNGVMICQVGDFGLAKQLEHTFQMAKTPLGTPYYMAPEIMQGKAYNYKSDIWALGCVLHEMCCRQPTFQGTDFNRVATRVLRRQHEPIPKNYSDDLRAVIGMMLSSSPTDRMHARDLLGSALLETHRNRYIQTCAQAGLSYKPWEPRLRPKPAEGAAAQPPKAKVPARLEPLQPLSDSPARPAALPPLKSSMPPVGLQEGVANKVEPDVAAGQAGRKHGLKEALKLDNEFRAMSVKGAPSAEAEEEESYEDDFEEYDDDWESDTEESPMQSGIIMDQRKERAQKLRDHCEAGMGQAKFEKVYALLKGKTSMAEEDELMTTIELEEVLGIENMEYWPLVDEIIFYESMGL